MKKVTVPQVKTYKASKVNKPLVAITAYDYPTSLIANKAEVDIILVGDSLAMTTCGQDNTLKVTIEQMEYHTLAVAAARPQSLLVTDMPWLSYHLDEETTITNAAKLIKAGADAVKLEGGQKRIKAIESLVNTEIPVMGHLGLTPQSIKTLDGFKVQAKDQTEAKQLLDDAKILEELGCFSIVLEAIPAELAAEITQSISIPTIGIGAGNSTDGQVLVFADLTGLETRFKPKFVRQYANAFEVLTQAVEEYAEDVRSKKFPSEKETY